MDTNTTARLLWAAVGGILAAGLLRVLLPGPSAVGRVVMEAFVLLAVSVALFRVLSRRSGGDP